MTFMSDIICFWLVVCVKSVFHSTTLTPQFISKSVEDINYRYVKILKVVLGRRKIQHFFDFPKVEVPAMIVAEFEADTAQTDGRA